MKMLHKILILVSMLALMVNVVCYAAPDTLFPNEISTAVNLITVRSPKSTSVTTTKKSIGISVSCDSGITVTLYKFDPSIGLYKKVFVNGRAQEAVVGASRLFVGQVELTSGVNKIWVWATKTDSLQQYKKLEIKLLGQNFLDSTKSNGVFDFTNVFK